MNELLQELDAFLLEKLRSDVETLDSAARQMILAGGKRIRPRIALLAYQSVSNEPMQKMIPIAAAVELLHTATLVHDDINDQGLIRRGQPTVNAQVGQRFAILTGNFLFTKVYQIVAPYGDLNEEFAFAAKALVEGETLQAVAAKNNQLNRETYMEVIAKKTASLFVLGTKTGAILGKGTKEQIDALWKYGLNVGLAFQIVDDILDLVKDSEELGKTTGIDVLQGRGFIKAVTSEELADNINETKDPRHFDDEVDPMIAFRSKLMQGNYVQEGRLQAEILSSLAVDALNALPDSEAKNELIRLAQEIARRDF